MKKKVYVRLHAARRMLERDIRMEEVEWVLDTGQIIEQYPDDTPHPSRLMLGWPSSRPLHVVAADDETAAIVHVITAYRPDPNKWDQDFKRRIR